MDKAREAVFYQRELDKAQEKEIFCPLPDIYSSIYTLFCLPARGVFSNKWKAKITPEAENLKYKQKLKIRSPIGEQSNFFLALIFMKSEVHSTVLMKGSIHETLRVCVYLYIDAARPVENFLTSVFKFIFQNRFLLTI